MTVAIDRDSALKKAEKLLRQGRLDSAIAEYERLVQDLPQDLTTANVLGDLYVRSGQRESAVAQYLRIATHLEREGFFSKASALYKKILKIKPDDEDVLERAAGIAVRQGLLADARAALTALAARKEARGDRAGLAAIQIRLGELDPSDLDGRLSAVRTRVARGDRPDTQSLLQLAEDLTGRQRQDDAFAVLREAARLDPDRADVQQAILQALVLRREFEAAFEWVDRMADRAIASGDWTGALAAVEPFLERSPHHVPALMKVVEICVDAGFDDRVSAAQAQLADAYLEAGAGKEARIIAEDLLAREPENLAHTDRLRRALVLLGEPDPDEVITEHLLGSGFDLPDLDLSRLEEPEDVQPEPEAAAPDVPAAELASPSNTVAAPQARPADPDADLAEAIDINSLLSELSAADSNGTFDEREQMPEIIELDLSDELARLESSEPAPELAPADPAADLDALFAELRANAARGPALDAADRAYRTALEREAAGRDHEAISLLETAARSPMRRFDAGARLARLFVKQERWHEAVDWFERAAEAPASSAEEGHALLYDLGRALEAGGESTRALAVYIELQADAGRYRDVAERIDRISASGTRG